jgi:acyl carrier protein
MSQDLDQKVIEIIAEQLGMGADEIEPDMTFVEDLGADSLDIVELIMALEEEFSVQVPDEDAEDLLTIQQTIDYIAGKLK